MSSINLLLPINSTVTIGDSQRKVTTLRMRKLFEQKEFKIQLFDGKEKVLETRLTNMSIKIKSGEDFIILEIINKQKVVVHLKGDKFLPDLDLKKYITTLVI